MKISDKIILLILFLWAVLAANTWFGLHQMAKIREAFAVTDLNNIALMEGVSGMQQIQLHKDILLQKLMG